MQAYFISDLHIGANQSNVEFERQKFILSFLRQIKENATHLFIVGDLFDFWFEYKQVIPKKYFRFLVLFDEMIQNGIKIYYLAGNHDFALGQFFKNELGIGTFQDHFEIELSGRRFFLLHGDGIDSGDRGYRILKRILRNPTNQKLFRLIHPDLGIPLARLISGSSRHYSQRMPPKNEQDYYRFAEAKFTEGFDYVIMGHRHNPLIHRVGDHLYINLGDWLVNNTYALFDGSNLNLHYYTK